MSQTKCLSLFAGVAASLSAASLTLADSQSWTESGMNADEVRAIVSEMLADADNRSSLLQSGSAGHDGSHFFLAGSGFKLTVGGQIQFRYIANFGDDGGIRGDDFESGFQDRRTRLEFGGEAWGDWGYFVQGDFGTGGGFTLLDAWVSRSLDNGWGIRWGQFKLPFLREELVSSKRQLAADRSFTNSVFTLGRAQGVELQWEGDDWRFAAAFSDGGGSANTDFTANKAIFATFDPITSDLTSFSLSGGESEWALTGRAEWKWAGNWSDLDDFTANANEEYSGMLGAAVHFEGGEAGTFDALGAPLVVDYTLFSWTVDASVEGNGWNAFAAYVGTALDTDDFADDVQDNGFVIQGGLLIPDSDWEVFARWDGVLPDGDRGGDDAFNTLTVGTNYYLQGHAAKFTLDLQWFFDEGDQNDLVSTNTGVGYIFDDQDSQLALRGQFQLLF